MSKSRSSRPCKSNEPRLEDGNNGGSVERQLQTRKGEEFGLISLHQNDHKTKEVHLRECRDDGLLKTKNSKLGDQPWIFGFGL